MFMRRDCNTLSYFRQYANVFDTEHTKSYVSGMTTMRDVLEELLAKSKWDEYRLADASGVPQPTINRFRKGRHGEMRSKTVQAIAAAFNVTEQQMRGLEPLHPEEAIAGARPVLAWDKREDLPDTHLLVRHVRVRFSAGSGQIEFEEEDDGHLAFTRRWMKKRGLNPDQLLVVSAIGDSMVPTISDGSSIVLDRSQCVPQDGHIYAIRYGEELRVKRIYKRYDGGLVLRSDNGEKYPDEAIPPEDLRHITIIGRVVHVSNDV